MSNALLQMSCMLPYDAVAERFLRAQTAAPARATTITRECMLQTQGVHTHPPAALNADASLRASTAALESNEGLSDLDSRTPSAATSVDAAVRWGGDVWAECLCTMLLQCPRTCTE